MRYITTILLIGFSITASGQSLKKALKFSTFYTAFSGGNSLSDREIFSVGNGLQTDIVETPFDYSFTAGISLSFCLKAITGDNRASTISIRITF